MQSKAVSGSIRGYTEDIWSSSSTLAASEALVQKCVCHLCTQDNNCCFHYQVVLKHPSVLKMLLLEFDLRELKYPVNIVNKVVL